MIELEANTICVRARGEMEAARREAVILIRKAKVEGEVEKKSFAGKKVKMIR